MIAAHTETSPTAQRLAAEYKARQARFAAAARKVANRNRYEPVIVETIVQAEEETPVIQLIVHVRNFDAHMDGYRNYKAEKDQYANTRLKRYILRRAYEQGLTYADMTGTSRRRHITAARDAIVYELRHDVKPDISYPDLARLFKKDHASMIASYRRGAMRAGDPVAAEEYRQRCEGLARQHAERKARKR